MKKLTAVLLSALILLLFAACSSGKTEDETSASSESATAASSDTSETGTGTEDGKGFDLSEMTVGKITKISNNQVTLELGTIDEDSIEKPSMPEGVSAPEDGSAPSGHENGSKPEKSEDGSAPSMPEGASAPADMPSDFDPDNMPEDFDPDNMPEGMSKPENMPDGAGGFSGSVTAEVTYTGETARYTIPSEVKVGNGDYTSLSKGDVIALGFDDDGIVNTVMLITEKGTD